MVRRIVVLLGLGLFATACSGTTARNSEADGLTPPKVGVCRNLAAADLAQPSDASPPVPCTKSHTVETVAVGTLPATTGSAYDDKRHGTFAFNACSTAFRDFLGADESLAMRSQFSWAWFRPSQRAWDRGARWYRCDLVGGPTGAKTLRSLPAAARGIFTSTLPDEWLTCARGTTVAHSTKVPCSQPHDWRAVTTIKVGQPEDPYPGDRIVQVRSRDRCSDWVGAYLKYPDGYDYGYTWFHAAEWATGNRRSICWERTPR